MKLNWLGKAFLGAAAAAAVGTIYEKATAGGGEGEKFTDGQLMSLIDAARRSDFASFSALWRAYRPGASNDSILEGWSFCLEYVANNG